jgi:hypothetical protein
MGSFWAVVISLAYQWQSRQLVMLTWVRSLRDRITNWHEGWVMLTWVSRQGAGREQAGSLFIANDSQQQ